MKVHYHNSAFHTGTKLHDHSWFALESAGWKVKWVKDMPWLTGGKDRYLGVLAIEAVREGLSYEEAVKEWQEVTGLNSNKINHKTFEMPHNFGVSE